MAKVFVENTGKIAQPFYGVMLQPGESAWVDPAPLPPPAPTFAVSRTASGKYFSNGQEVPELSSLGAGAGPFRGLRLVYVGHSYLDQESDTFSYNRPIQNLHGTMAWANFYLGWPFELVRSHAIGGERLIDLADRLAAARAEKADGFVWNMGINDLKETKNAGNSRFTGRPYVVDPNQRNVAYCIALATQDIKALADTYGFGLLLPETAPANGATDQLRQLAARTAQYNRALKQLAASDSRLVYVDIDRVTWDPLSATAAVQTVGGASAYSDTIHPGPAVSAVRGKMIAMALKPLVKKLDRLPSNIFETYTNLKIAGTSLSANGDGTLRVNCPNAASGLTLIREGDLVGLAVPSAGNTAWNGRWFCVVATATYVDLACSIPGSYTGTINLSAAEQLFDNPLIATQTGGTKSGAGSLTGALPANMAMDIPTGCSATVTYVAHTDLDGVADGLGYWLDIELTIAASQLVSIWAQSHRSNVASPVYGRVHPGDAIQVGFDVEIVGTPSGVYELDFGALVLYTPPASGQVAIPVLTMYRASTLTAPHPNVGGRGSVMTGEWRTPNVGSLDTIDGQVQIKAGAGGPATIRIRLGRIGVYALRSTLRNVDVALDI